MGLGTYFGMSPLSLLDTRSSGVKPRSARERESGNERVSGKAFGSRARLDHARLTRLAAGQTTSTDRELRAEGRATHPCSDAGHGAAS